MAEHKLSRLELKVMNVLWERGPCSVREILDSLPGRRRPAYTTVQTVLYRLEAKDAVRRTKKIGNAHIFEAALNRSKIRRGVVDELLSVFDGRAQPLVQHLIESGQLTLDDIEDARKLLRELSRDEE